MVYSNDELAALEDELDNVPDRPEALHPSQTHVASRNAIAAGGPPCRQYLDVKCSCTIKIF